MMLKKFAYGIVIYGITVFTLFSCSVFWTSPSYYQVENEDSEIIKKVISFSEYGKFSESHPRPFIVKKENLVLFGSEHTKSPSDPQFKTVQELWSELKPTVALVEGRLGFLFVWVMDPVETYGEMGFVKRLADKDGIDVFTWETPKDLYMKEMLKTYSKKQMAIKEVLNPYFSNLRFGKPESPEDYVKGYLHRANEHGLDNAISSIEDIDQFWKETFPDEKDWRDTSDQWGLPGFLGEMSVTANDIRNRHIAIIIQNLLNKGERVFAIMGSSHAVMLQDTF